MEGNPLRVAVGATSLAIVIAWTLFLFFFSHQKPPPNPSSSPNSEVITITARSHNGTFQKRINLSETVIYIDMWRSHWCTYYNDREFFFTPRINEIAQRARAVGVPIVHISMGADAFTGRTHQRKSGRTAVARGNLSVLEQYNAQAARYHKHYIPGFVDSCVYKDQQRFGKYRDNHLTRAIAVASDDLIVQNFKESAMSFVGLGAKTVIVLGQHTNMCLMAVFLYCREVGLDLVIVRDLVDTCWVFENQKMHCPTHSMANHVVNSYFEQTFGSSITSYDLISAMEHAPTAKHQPTYDMFTDTAFLFSSITRR